MPISYFKNGYGRRILSALALLAGFAAFSPGRAAASELVVHDDFNGQEIGAAPAGWTTPHRWRVRTEGGITLLTMEEGGSWNGQAHERRITKRLPAPSGRSWVLELDYAWRWGGDPTSKRGYHNLRLDVLMVDAAGNGYCVRIPQGGIGLSGADAAERLFRMHRVTSWQVGSTPLAEGRGYDRAGWKSINLAKPELHGVRLSWDRKSRRLTAYRKIDGAWEAVIEVPNVLDGNFDRLAVDPSSFTGSVAPQIDNVRLYAPRELVWGVVGHADNGAAFPVYRTIGAAIAIQKVKELGMERYRVDTVEVADAPTGNTFFDAVLAAADAQGVSLLPVLSTTKVNTTDLPIEQVYELNFTKAKNFATFYRGRFTHVEVLNEIDNAAIIAGDGSLVSHYDSAKLARYAAVFRGLCDGLKAGDPAVKRLVGTAGWYHYGFIDYLNSQGVEFEILAWHWYSVMGSMQRVMNRLATYGKPIWITEFNRWEGTYFGTRLSDSFGLHALGAAPAGWARSGEWRVDRHGLDQLVTNTDLDDGGGARTLGRPLDMSVDANREWELGFSVGWQRGGVAGAGGHGDYSIYSEVDLVNSAGAGFRLRVRQGDGGDPLNGGRILQLYRLDPAGTPSEVLVAEGGGPGAAGWMTRGLSAPSLTRLRLQWAYNWNPAVLARRLSLRWGDGNGTTVFSIPYDEPMPTVDRVVLRARGTAPGGVGAQFDSILFRHENAVATEPEQARTLEAMAAEMSSFPQVEALFVYELFDQPNHQTSERNYGLYKVRRNAQFVYFEDGPRLGAEVLKNFVARRGVLPAEPGSVTVDNSSLWPASFALGPWSEETVSTSMVGGHMVAGDGVSTSFVRFCPYIAEAGAHAVWIHFPVGAADIPGVPVRVNTQGGLVSASVLQPARGGWVKAGEFTFKAGESATTGAYVEIRAGEAGATLADAVRFQRKGVGPWSKGVFSNLEAPDVDGVPLMLKAATAMPVGAPGPYPIVSLSITGDAMALSFNQPLASPFFYMVEASEDLVAWDPIAIGEGTAWFSLGATVSQSGSGEMRRITVVDPVATSAAPRRFLRLWVEQ